MKKISLPALVFLLLFSLLFCGFQSGAAQGRDKTFTNSIGMEFVLIPSGSFMMGRDPAFEEGNDSELPQHKVNISKPFYLGKYQVTQTQWEAVMGSNPSKFKGRNNPVEQVSWDDAQAFIKRLNAKEGHSRYRLPTEAEWEYAARAGTSSAYTFGDDKHDLSGYAWYDGNSGDTTRPVGQEQSNGWGLYDVHGNIWEWVQDWHGKKYYANSPETDPKGPSSREYRVFLGGSWYDVAFEYCRSASRGYDSPDIRDFLIGFRLALSPE
ncbi:MAG: formylglycine-generating enzyme family protein [Desulfovibrionaceae bacterium]|nr:formylglycine-generating enzyme family protein [Desulfovibrionaceae bacterium]